MTIVHVVISVLLCFQFVLRCNFQLDTIVKQFLQFCSDNNFTITEINSVICLTKIYKWQLHYTWITK